MPNAPKVPVADIWNLALQVLQHAENNIHQLRSKLVEQGYRYNEASDCWER